MTYAIQEPVIRTVARGDTAGVTRFVASVRWHGPTRPASRRVRRPARDLCPRHGYLVRSVIELPDGPPLWTMWRPPMVR
jgi:hypothetical protein